MPITSTEHPRGWAVMVLSDPYTAEEFTPVMESIMAGRTSPGPLRMLVDRRNANPPTAAFVERIISFINSIHGVELVGARVGIVVGDDTGIGMARMSQIRTQQSMPTMAVEVFGDLARAERWLEQRDECGRPA
jgi:hypothetical protein